MKSTRSIKAVRFDPRFSFPVKDIEGKFENLRLPYTADKLNDFDK